MHGSLNLNHSGMPSRVILWSKCAVELQVYIFLLADFLDGKRNAGAFCRTSLTPLRYETSAASEALFMFGQKHS